MTTSRDKQAGFTLVEVAIVSVVLGVLSLSIVHSLADLTRIQAFTHGQTRAAEVADRVLQVVARDVTYSVRVFMEGERGREHLAVMDYPEDRMLANSRMPVLTHQGYFERDDPECKDTGNMLLMACNREPVMVSIGSAVTPSRYRIDTMAFVLYHLVEMPGGGLDLVRWASMPLASYRDIAAIRDVTERAIALSQLWADGVRYAWDLSGRTTSALMSIQQSGRVQPLQADERIPGDLDQQRSGLLGDRHLEIAANGRVGHLNVPDYACPNETGFPGGFEVKIDGPTSGKLVLIRLVVRSAGNGIRDNFAQARQLVSCRDG